MVTGNGGSGISNSGTATVTGSTVSGNADSFVGGGIYNDGTLAVLDSIFRDNIPDNIYGPYTDLGGNTFN